MARERQKNNKKRKKKGDESAGRMVRARRRGHPAATRGTRGDNAIKRRDKEGKKAAKGRGGGGQFGRGSQA